MQTETTFVAIKPDGTSRGLIGRIIARYEDLGLKLVGLKLMQISRQLAENHYAEHKGKPFFEDLVQFITSGPVVCMALNGIGAIDIVRKINGSTDPAKAPPGTIRGDFALSVAANIVHASDGTESALRELKLFFSEGLLEIS